MTCYGSVANRTVAGFFCIKVSYMQQVDFVILLLRKYIQ